MNQETTPSPTELDLSTAPDEVWLYGQGERLAQAHASGSTESIPAQDGDAEADVVIVTTRGARSDRLQGRGSSISGLVPQRQGQFGDRDLGRSLAPAIHRS
jgi:hypothetical protein